MKTLERDLAFAKLYLLGVTQAEIASMHGVTQQRVCQVLRGQGITRRDGGAGVRPKAEKPSRHASAAEWGVSNERYRELTRDGYTRAYTYQRNNALRRGLQWELSRAEWLSLWERSGKWAQRGRGGDKYGLCRIDPRAPFRADNIAVMRNADAARENIAIVHRDIRTGIKTPLAYSLANDTFGVPC